MNSAFAVVCVLVLSFCPRSACVSVTIDRELKDELETVSAFAQARAALEASFDLPEKKKNLLLKLCWQGSGVLSATKRSTHFKEYSDDEIGAILAVIAPFFKSR